jgi:hypothetical protein
MPGTPGTKEAYGISIIREDYSIRIPPKSFTRYGLKDNDTVLLMTTHIEEGGLAMIKKDQALESVFKKYVDKIKNMNEIYLNKKRAYVLTNVVADRIFFNEEMLKAFNLKLGDRLMVVKSTTIAMSYTPVEVWEEKFRKRGLFEAIENMKYLEEY